MATTKNANYKVYNGTDYDTINFSTTASNVSIADSGGRISATNAENALQEIVGAGRTTETIKGNATAIANLDAELTSHKADYATDEGIANAYKITLTPAPVAYEIGKIYKFKAINANTGASTFQIGSLAVTAIKKNVSADLVAGDILANQIIAIIYDGTNFQLIPINPFSLLASSGDIIYASGASTPARLAKGTDGQALVLSGGLPTWGSVGASIISGIYSGNGTQPRTISIGFTPKEVTIFSINTSSSTYFGYSGVLDSEASTSTQIALGNTTVTSNAVSKYGSDSGNGITMVTNGFKIGSNFNLNSITYRYIAKG